MIFNIKMEEIEKELDNEDNVIECVVSIETKNVKEQEEPEEPITIDDLIKLETPFIQFMNDNESIDIKYDNYVFKRGPLGRGLYKEKFNLLDDTIDHTTQTDEMLKKFNLFWQFPVITEKRFYIQNYKNENYFGFPWATIIDKRYNLDLIYKLLSTEYKIDYSKQYYTCVQHVSFRKIFPLLEKLNIKTVYTPHKVIGEDSIDNITLKSCPLYAVGYEDKYRCQTYRNFENNVEYFNSYDIIHKKVDKIFLYSFIGAYNPRDYLTDIRKKIFDMKHSENCIIQNTKSWHFDEVVYSKIQNIKNYNNNLEDYFINSKGTFNTKMKESCISYNYFLLTSRYSLCPSGSGPNSIRLWESLAVGAIPILLADTLELPKHELWEKAILHIPEKDVETIPSILEKITQEEEDEMRKNCLEIYDHFRNNYINCEQSEEQSEEQSAEL